MSVLHISGDAARRVYKPHTKNTLLWWSGYHGGGHGGVHAIC